MPDPVSIVAAGIAATSAVISAIDVIRRVRKASKRERELLEEERSIKAMKVDLQELRESLPPNAEIDVEDSGEDLVIKITTHKAEVDFTPVPPGKETGSITRLMLTRILPIVVCLALVGTFCYLMVKHGGTDGYSPPEALTDMMMVFIGYFAGCFVGQSPG